MSISENVARRVLVREKIPGSAVPGLVDFLEKYYLTPAKSQLAIDSYSKGGPGADGSYDLRWKTTRKVAFGSNFQQGEPISVRLNIGANGIVIDFEGTGVVDPNKTRAFQRVADDVEEVATTFLARAKRTSLYFVFSLEADKTQSPQEAGGNMGSDMRKKMFSGNATNLFLSIMVLGFILFLTIGTIAIFAIFAVQFLALIFSDKLILGSGNVRPDKNRQEVAVIRIASTPETEKVLMQMEDRLNKSIKEQLKRAISEDTASEEEKRSKILDILVQHGVPCSLDDVEIVIRNPYSIVESTAQKFQLPVPKVSIMNSTVDNAAATGVSHGRSSILITAGALEDLDDNELTSVVGHELGHVKGRDPLILFSVTLVVYIGGFYLWLPVLLYLGFFYFILAFALTYAVGKVLETRADTQSMIVLGTPNVLASALTSIGFRRLYFERYSRRYRVLDWLSFDPHPPIYFRVNRLASYAARGAKVKHALIVSVRDCAVGFFQSLVR